MNENVPLLEKKEAADKDQTLILGLPAWLVSILWVAGGVLAACYIEGWNIDTALYVIVQVVTTIGYGDITMTGDKMKFWVSLYVVGTLILVATYVGEVMDNLLNAQTDFLKKRVSASKQQARALDAPSSENGDTLAEELADFAVDAAQASLSILPAFVIFALFVISGTLFYGLMESCTCSYGVTAIEGCIEDPFEKCYETGGATNSWVEAFYMSIITLTTVGFGDHSPKSRVGRIFGCVWMLCGVAATANLMGNVGKALLEHKRHRKHLTTVSRSLFDKMDASHDGRLSKNEFRNFALIKFGLVSPADIREIDELFASMDTDKTGSLSFAEISQACDHPASADVTRPARTVPQAPALP